MSERHSGTIIQLGRPRIEHERDGWGGWLVMLSNGHAWLAGDRAQALAEFSDLEHIERRGRP